MAERVSSEFKGIVWSFERIVDNMIDFGDVAVLKDDKSTRVLWKLAKVEELIRSRDNVFLAAMVRVVNSDEGRSIVLRRPIQHLIPLELPSTSEEEDHVSEVRETPLGGNVAKGE